MQGIDVGSKVEICRLIGELAEAGAGIILISSGLREILALADGVVVMRKGRIVANLARDQATQAIVLGAIFGASAACWNLTTGKNSRPMAGGESISVTDHEVELAEPHVRKGLRLRWETIGVPVAILTLAVIFGVLNPTFTQLSNLANISRQIASTGLVAWGQTMVILTA